jgi:TatD DNase family protein
MALVDTHCHIHSPQYEYDIESVFKNAAENEVTKLICVGTDEKDSAVAVEFVQNRENCWASIGLHPHDANMGAEAVNELKSLISQPKVVAVGECGLDFFYNHSPKEAQLKMLKAQIELALEHEKPLIFHVREAFDDFWPVFDSYNGIRGVLHSFTDTEENLQKAVQKGLFIGVNGIATFTKKVEQTAMYKQIPLEKLLLETDSPFLTPVPYRGKVNEPAFVKLVASHMADLHAISLEELSAATSKNATTLFNLN